MVRSGRNIKLKRIEDQLLPHADTAYNLARWLVRNDHDACDIVQDSYLKAFQAFESFRGEEAKAWLLKIVRNTSYTWLEKRRAHPSVEFNEEVHSEGSSNPENFVLQKADQTRVRAALDSIAPEYREVIVLRELEEMPYDEIAEVAGIAMGTVMSRLSRGRSKILEFLKAQEAKEERR